MPEERIMQAERKTPAIANSIHVVLVYVCLTTQL